MKNRILPSGYLAAFVGLSFLLISTLTLAGNPGASNQKVDGKSRIEKMRANQNTGIVNPADVMKAQQQYEKMQAKSPSALNLDWISIGPDNFAGVTWSVMFDNRDPNGKTIYAGSVNGGIWRSQNLGLTWHQINSQSLIVPKVSSLVQTPAGVIYASTGVNTCETPEFLGNGLYRSDDGENFVLVPNTTGINWTSVSKLAVDPTNSRIYAATNSGLLYSNDGTEFTQVLEGNASDVVVGSDGTVLAACGRQTYLAAAGDIENFVNLSDGIHLPNFNAGWTVFGIAPSDPNVLYASIADTVGDLLNVYLSTDKGATWNVIYPGDPSYGPFNGNGCYAHTFAVSPADPFKVFLGGSSMWEGTRIEPMGYYNWERVSSGAATVLDYWYVPNSHHCYVFRPNDPHQFAIATDGGVTVGTDNGEFISFQTSNRNYIVSRFHTIAHTSKRYWAMGGADKIGTQTIGAFYPALVNDYWNGFQVWLENVPPYPANMGGNGGTCAWSSIDPNIAIFSKMGSDSTIRRQELRDLSYLNAFQYGKINRLVDIVPLKFWESFNFEYSRDSVKYVARDSTVHAGTTLVLKSSNGQFPFSYTFTETLPMGDSIMAMDPVASRFFYYVAGTTNGIYMTKDALQIAKDPKWYLIFKDLVIGDPLSAIAISPDLNTLWIGSEEGRLCRASNLSQAYDYATADWNSSTCVVSHDSFLDMPFKDRMISSIYVNPNSPNQVLVTVGNYGNADYVYMTENALDSLPVFRSVQGNLPAAPVFSGIIEMHDNNRAIIGTEFGLMSTTDLMSTSPTWSPDIRNIGNVPVMDIKQQTMNNPVIENYGSIFIASYGRGMWMDTSFYSPVGIDPGQPQTTPSGSLLISPNPVTDVVKITYTLETSSNISLTLVDLRGRTVMNLSLGFNQKGTHTTKLNLNGLPSGTYMVRVGNAHGKIVKM